MSVNVTADNQDLKVLVQELTKTNPSEQVLKTKTDVLGIPYSADLIILMSEVLVYLSKNTQKGPLKENPA